MCYQDVLWWKDSSCSLDFWSLLLKSPFPCRGFKLCISSTTCLWNSSPEAGECIDFDRAIVHAISTESYGENALLRSILSYSSVAWAVCEICERSHWDPFLNNGRHWEPFLDIGRYWKLFLDRAALWWHYAGISEKRGYVKKVRKKQETEMGTGMSIRGNCKTLIRRINVITIWIWKPYLGLVHSTAAAYSACTYRACCVSSEGNSAVILYSQMLANFCRAMHIMLSTFLSEMGILTSTKCFENGNEN